MDDFALFIDGRWHDEGEPQEIRSPYDGRVVGRCRRATPALLERAIDAADRARTALRDLPLGERAAVLERAAAALRARRDEFAHGIEAEAGKPLRYARAEAERAADTLTEAAVAARRLDGLVLPMDAYAPGVGRVGIVKRFPVGPVAAITPFNFPLNLVCHKVAPAIAAGCPVVLKPASQTPLTALRLAGLLAEAGLPAGGLNVVPLPGSAAAALNSDPRIRLLTFTGSPEVGWDLKARAGEKKVILELGGNAAGIVDADVDLERAARRLAQGAFAYAGQTCISVQRIYVHHDVLDRFRDALVAAVAHDVGVGDPAREATVCGPMIDRGNADRVQAWIDEAAGRGARVLTPARREGNVVWPAVVEGVDPALPLSCGEVFGPAVTLDGVRSFDEALARANDSRYGLQAGVFTRDVARALRAFETLEVGGVIVNDFPTYRVDHMPYGGVKNSGSGREGPRWTVEEMTEPRLLVLNPTIP